MFEASLLAFTPFFGSYKMVKFVVVPLGQTALLILFVLPF